MLQEYSFVEGWLTNSSIQKSKQGTEKKNNNTSYPNSGPPTHLVHSQIFQQKVKLYFFINMHKIQYCFQFYSLCVPLKFFARSFMAIKCVFSPHRPQFCNTIAVEKLTKRWLPFQKGGDPQKNGYGGMWSILVRSVASSEVVRNTFVSSSFCCLGNKWLWGVISASFSDRWDGTPPRVQDHVWPL